MRNYVAFRLVSIRTADDQFGHVFALADDEPVDFWAYLVNTTYSQSTKVAYDIDVFAELDADTVRALINWPLSRISTSSAAVSLSSYLDDALSKNLPNGFGLDYDYLREKFVVKSPRGKEKRKFKLVPIRK